MSQYAVLYNEKSKTFTIKDEDAQKPNEKAYSHLFKERVGEMAEATVHPEPAEHLKNLARLIGVEYRFFTVKNDSTNDYFDKLEREGEEVTDVDRTVQVISGDESGSELMAPAEVN